MSSWLFFFGRPAHRVLTTALFALSILGPAFAGDANVPLVKYQLWVPDPWAVRQQDGIVTAHSPTDTIRLVVGVLGARGTGLSDPKVTEFIAKRLAGLAIGSDQMTTAQDDVPARRLEGTARDGERAVVFRALAIDPSTDAPAIVAVIWGEAAAMTRPEAKKLVERILASLHPS